MKIESLKKDELVKYCQSLNIIIEKRNKNELIEAVYLYRRDKIDTAIACGNDIELLKSEIMKIANEYAFKLSEKIINRKEEMKLDDNSHYMIYKVLGITSDKGSLIDEYQNTKTFEIDFLNGKDTIELKWRDATTDGDHITKEHTTS